MEKPILQLFEEDGVEYLATHQSSIPTLRVLEKTDERVLVISRDIIYEATFDQHCKTELWKDCALRSSMEKKMPGLLGPAIWDAVVEVELDNDLIPVSDHFKKYETREPYKTKDKVFVLSFDEANKYFADKFDRRCKPIKGVFSKGFWLRTPGRKVSSSPTKHACIVGEMGDINKKGSLPNEVWGVRPAFWLDRSKINIEVRDEGK